jgi:hypothetical protein
MSKEKDIRILEYRIADLERKILLYEERDISVKKIDALKMKKLKYETQLEEIQFA